MPWLSVMKHRLRREEQMAAVERDPGPDALQNFIDLVGLTGAEHKKPGALRADEAAAWASPRFAIQPQDALLDEPFARSMRSRAAAIQVELLAIVQATHSDVFMITHDVDEAILLRQDPPDVQWTARCDRRKSSKTPCRAPQPPRHPHDPQYYRIRNHLVDFLINRSKQMQGNTANRVAAAADGPAGGRRAADAPARAAANVINLSTEGEAT